MRTDYEPRIGESQNALRVIRKWQVQDLVGKLLTYVDATYSDKEQRDAHKDLVRHHVYKWFDSECWNEELEKAAQKGIDEAFPQDGPPTEEVTKVK